MLSAPAQAWSDQAGQLDGEGTSGFFVADVRAVRRAVLSLDGADAVPLAHAVPDAGTAVFTALVRRPGDLSIDPTVRLERRRRLAPHGPDRAVMTETVSVTSWAAGPVTMDITIEIDSDLAPLSAVKQGVPGEPVPPQRLPAPDAADPAAGPQGAQLVWSGAGVRVDVAAPGATVTVAGTTVLATWHVEVPPGGAVDVSWRVGVRHRSRIGLPAAPEAPFDASSLVVTGDDPRWRLVLARALDDLGALRLSVDGDPGGDTLAAGAPWFLTLFGRDSLWAARMLLPVSTAPAASTLATLARLQGGRADPATSEAPGKILHELRGGEFDIGVDHAAAGPAVHRSLPALYYGSIDATPLWVLTLVDAWRWGMAQDRVTELLPALQAALRWITVAADVDGDGFLEYRDDSGRGLANQGWKDSGDGIRHADGSLARAPLALCEVQGYAVEAATGAADLLDAFGRPGAPKLRAWARALAERFRTRFWVADADGPYPAVALDADKRPAGSLTSNIGHLLGTGILNDSEAALVAARLAAPALFSGRGIRTLAATSPGYSPLGYHVGSVWPHDTAIGLLGMVTVDPAAAPGAAGTVAKALLETLAAFDGRPPELFSGDAVQPGAGPLPYPAACRPQAWSSAAAVALVTAVLGLRPDGGTLRVSPVRPWTFGAMSVSGLQVGGVRHRVDVDASGAATVTRTDP